MSAAEWLGNYVRADKYASEEIIDLVEIEPGTFKAADPIDWTSAVDPDEAAAWLKQNGYAAAE